MGLSSVFIIHLLLIDYVEMHLLIFEVHMMALQLCFATNTSIDRVDIFLDTFFIIICYSSIMIELYFILEFYMQNVLKRSLL